MDSSQAPRSPNAGELQQLRQWLQSLGAYDEKSAAMTADSAYIAIYDRYCTGSPGYFGKLMSVVWDGSPSTYDVFVWPHNEMKHVHRDR